MAKDLSNVFVMTRRAFLLDFPRNFRFLSKKSCEFCVLIKLRAALAALCFALAATSPAGAVVIINTNLTSLPTAQGFTAVDLTNVPLGSASSFTLLQGTPDQRTVSFSGVAGGQGVVQGSASGQYAQPIVDASNTRFSGKYFSTGNTGYISIRFATAQRAFALLWGSVDSSNLLTLLANGVSVGTVRGSDISSNANGSQSFGGSFYTLLNSDVSFDEVRLSSGVTSFESASYVFNPNNFYIPEPASLALLAAGLGAMATARRRRVSLPVA